MLSKGEEENFWGRTQHKNHREGRDGKVTAV